MLRTNPVAGRRTGNRTCHDLPHCDSPVRRIAGKESRPAGPGPPQGAPWLRGQRVRCVSAGAGFPVRPVPGPRQPRDRGVHFLVDRHEITPASSRMPAPDRSSRYAPAQRSGTAQTCSRANHIDNGTVQPGGRSQGPSSGPVPAIRMMPERERPRSLDAAGSPIETVPRVVMDQTASTGRNDGLGPLIAGWLQLIGTHPHGTGFVTSKNALVRPPKHSAPGPQPGFSTCRLS